MNTDEIRKRHHPTAGLWWRCICGADYPCDAIRLADELDRVRAELAQTQDIAIGYRMPVAPRGLTERIHRHSTRNPLA